MISGEKYFYVHTILAFEKRLLKQSFAPSTGLDHQIQ
jgi:hypothetical protein